MQNPVDWLPDLSRWRHGFESRGAASNFLVREFYGVAPFRPAHPSDHLALASMGKPCEESLMT